MRYRVTFMERTNSAGEPSEFPSEYVDIDTPDGVVLDRTFVEKTAPSSLHNEKVLEEDDSFLSIGSETWDYDVAGGRESEFLEALMNSQMGIECVPLDDGAETPGKTGG